MIAHPIGLIIFLFLFFYVFGLLMVRGEKQVSKRNLPVLLKWLLFLNSRYKLTLNTIIYQSLILILTITALVLCSLVRNELNTVALLYRKFAFFVWFIEIIIVSRLGLAKLRGEIVQKRRRR